jgi:dihydroorotate dehydrogenase
MQSPAIQFRNKIIGFLYKGILKPVFFRFDPEKVHDRMICFGKALGKSKSGQKITAYLFDYSHKGLEQDILGIHFRNPIGLAAGFDKNAELTQVIHKVGFAFEEVGSITGFECLGNPKPRLWRLKESEGLVVYYGLKNDGAEIISQRMKNLKPTGIIGTSVAMTNCLANLDTDTAVNDYTKAFSAFVDIGDYFTINISCPNTEGGQPFNDYLKLDILLNKIDQIETKKPIFIKLSPDMSFEGLEKILDVAKQHRVHGIITTNLTKNKNNPKILDKNIPKVGGISGKPVNSLSDDMIAFIRKREGNRFIIIGCGGIFTAEDAYRKIRNGASLVQMITGMIFQGPQTISEINRGLVELLRRDGFKNISEAVGVDVD